MIWGLDTHALVWFLEDDPRLGKRALELLCDPKAFFFVPTLVLCEVHAMAHKKKIGRDLSKVIHYLKNDTRFELSPLDEKVLQHLPTGLDIHDGIIVATTVAIAKERKIKTALLTTDIAIRESHLVEVVWD